VDRDGASPRLSICNPAMSDGDFTFELGRALHRLRSALAAATTEAELLALDGVDSARLQRACRDALARLEFAERIGDALVSPSRRTSVVLLEDDEQLGLALLSRLNRLGFDACLVTTPVSALTWSRHGVLIADLSILESVAEEQVADVRRRQPVILTGATMTTAVQRADHFGAFATFTKPADMPTLAATIREHPASRSG
jgi:multidrug efflux pump subunit AcrA (membrane-fusion protein)